MYRVAEASCRYRSCPSRLHSSVCVVDCVHPASGDIRSVYRLLSSASSCRMSLAMLNNNYTLRGLLRLLNKARYLFSNRGQRADITEDLDHVLAARHNVSNGHRLRNQTHALSADNASCNVVLALSMARSLLSASGRFNGHIRVDRNPTFLPSLRVVFKSTSSVRHLRRGFSASFSDCKLGKSAWWSASAVFSSRSARLPMLEVSSRIREISLDASLIPLRYS